jgi:tetratricopeptide (TPR) repeat protein
MIGATTGEQSIAAAMRNPAMISAAEALAENRLHDAEPLLKTRLKQNPFDVVAMRMLAELAGRIGRYPDAENLLRRAVELAPDFLVAKSNLAMVLHKQSRSGEAIAILDEIALVEPGRMANANLRAAALGRIGEYDEALEIYAAVLEKRDNHPKIWMSYGHMLKTLGRQQDCIAAYRRALALQPGLGELWWSLANLKTVRFDENDIAAMTAALDDPALSAEDRFHLHFALGKAHDDAGDPAAAFAHYAEGNRLRRPLIDYDPEETRAQVDRAIAVFTPEFLSKRRGGGAPAPAPLFVLGMPRAGSTLIEQILASHPAIEGTMELPDIPIIAARAKAAHGGISEMDAATLEALGAEYLDRTRVHRKSDRPLFIDKLPNNWFHVGFIHLILPNAKIIDARRNPLDCCFSNFRQHFARGQGFAYSLDELGRYYADYARLMDHFDTVLPGRVHRVIHEQLLDNPEAEVRALLKHIGIDFDPACLRFYENDRAVQTASSEQVRRPINRDGVDVWKRYEASLDPLKQALGSLIADYPA